MSEAVDKASGQQFSGPGDSQESRLGSTITLEAPASAQRSVLALRPGPAPNEATGRGEGSISCPGHLIRASPKVGGSMAVGLQEGFRWPQLREEQVWQGLQTRLTVSRER